MQPSYRQRNSSYRLNSSNTREPRTTDPLNRINIRYTRTQTDQAQDVPVKPFDNPTLYSNIQRIDRIQRVIEQSNRREPVESGRKLSKYTATADRDRNSLQEQHQIRIRELIIRYEEREKLLLLELDNQKRKESYYSQETESLRKVNQSLQEELRIVHHKLEIYGDGHPSAEEFAIQNRYLKQQLEILQGELERVKMLLRNQQQRHIKEMNQIARHSNTIQQQLRCADLKLKEENERAETGVLAQRRLSETEKQCAQLVIQNCSLKQLLSELQSKYEKCSQQLSNYGKDYLSDLQAQLLMLEHQNAQLQQQNTTLANNCYLLEQSYNRLTLHPSKENPPVFPREPSHTRCKTQTSYPSTFTATKRRPSVRRDTLSQSFQKFDGSEKQSLNDAIVRRCRLTVPPR